MYSSRFLLLMQKSLDAVDVYDDKTNTKLLAISRRQTELKKVFEAQQQKIIVITNLQNASSTPTAEADGLLILRDKESQVSKKMEDLSTSIKNTAIFNSFLQQFDEVVK